MILINDLKKLNAVKWLLIVLILLSSLLYTYAKHPSEISSSKLYEGELYKYSCDDKTSSKRSYVTFYLKGEVPFAFEIGRKKCKEIEESIVIGEHVKAYFTKAYVWSVDVGSRHLVRYVDQRNNLNVVIFTVSTLLLIGLLITTIQRIKKIKKDQKQPY